MFRWLAIAPRSLAESLQTTIGSAFLQRHCQKDYVHVIVSWHCPKELVAARGVNSGSVLCKRHNGRILCADSTYTHGSFFAVYHRSESGVLDSNKLKEQEALRLVPWCNLVQFVRPITRYHVGYHGNVQKCAKATGFMAIQTNRTYPTCDDISMTSHVNGSMIVIRIWRCVIARGCAASPGPAVRLCEF